MLDRAELLSLAPPEALANYGHGEFRYEAVLVLVAHTVPLSSAAKSREKNG